MGEGTAPDNIKRYAFKPIPLAPGKENFETGLKLDANLVAQHQALNEKDFGKYKQLGNTKQQLDADKVE